MRITIKCISLILCLCLLAAPLASCGEAETGGKLRVVTTIFPLYDWVRQVAGDRAKSMEITMLLDKGTDLHSYQPTADDIIRVSGCDLFICVGGESDDWVDKVLREGTNKNMVVLRLMEVLGDQVKEEELAEGMEGEEEGEEGEEDEPEYDEHVWLSLKNAAFCCEAIADALAGLDAGNGEAYKANCAAYRERLDALDGAYREAVAAGRVKTVLFGDRFPFRYLTDDYGLDYYAAFSGCSAESEASFETILFLAKKTDELGLKSILQIESADGKIARTIRDTTKTKDQTILTLDSMQSITAPDVENGATYLSIMEKNLDLLREALR